MTTITNISVSKNGTQGRKKAGRGKTNFCRDFFVSLARECGLNAGDFELLSHRNNSEMVLGEDLLDKLIEIQNQFARLQEMDEDEFRGFYIEIPRPTPEEWGDCEEDIAAGYFEDKDDYLKGWKDNYPNETYWYFVASAIYMERRSIRFTDRKFEYFCISNYSHFWSKDEKEFNDESDGEIIGKLAVYFQKLIDAITKDPTDFNKYVADSLPYQQRDGRIARRDLNRILPRLKTTVKDEETAMKALKASVSGNFGMPMQSMTIRTYCKYFRIAHEAYERYFDRFEDVWRKYRTQQTDAAELNDIDYYKRVKFGYLKSEYNVDSEEDFKKFAKDHYCELGLSRLNIHASNFEVPGWIISVSNSYSSCVDVAIDVATALYTTGAPMRIEHADKLLKILKEEDHVRLMPYTFHDYMNHHEEGTVFELPWEFECSDDEDSSITPSQYREIISLTQWFEIEKVKVKRISSKTK